MSSERDPPPPPMSGERDPPPPPSAILGGGFLVNVNLTFASTIANYGFGLLAFILIARALGPEGRGITALFQAGVNLAMAVLSLGIAQAAIYFISRREIRHRDALEAALDVTLFCTAVTGLVVLAGALFFADILATDGLPYWLAIVAVPAVVQLYAVEGTLRGLGRFGRSNILGIFATAATFFGLLALEISVGLTVRNTVYAWTLTTLPAVVLGYLLVGRSAWPRRPAAPALLTRMVRFGVQGQLSNLIQLLNYRLDAYLVLLFVNTAGVGLYSVAVSTSEGMWFVANSVAVVLLTNLTAGDDEHAARMTPIVCRNTILVTALGSIAAAALSPVVIPLVFGKAFDDAVVPFLCLLPGTIALAGSKILAAYVFSRGRPMINAWIALATLFVTVLADLILIPLFEVTGAALGASVAYGVSLALSAVAYQRLSGGSIVAALLPRPSDLALYASGLRSLLGRLPIARRAAGDQGAGGSA